MPKESIIKNENLPDFVIGGLIPLTMIDYPGKMACVIFCQGCVWNCTYCHNQHLRPMSCSTDFGISWEKAYDFLKQREGFLEAVVLSGGEPLLQKGLPLAIQKIKELGFLVGLHTSGSFPDRLKEMVKLVDWIGLDIKAPFSKYPDITGHKESSLKAQASLKILRESKIAYEVRTTVDPNVLNESDVLSIAEFLIESKVNTYALQEYRPLTSAEKFIPIRSFISQKTITDLESQFQNFFIRSAQD